MSSVFASVTNRLSNGFRGFRPWGKSPILVVEDSRSVAIVLSRILENDGYQVVVASDGADALRLSEAKGPFSLMITDVVMPGQLDGFSLSRALRDRQTNLPVIFISGYPAEVEKMRRGYSGEDVFLVKPVRMADIRSAVKKSLSGGCVEKRTA